LRQPFVVERRGRRHRPGGRDPCIAHRPHLVFRRPVTPQQTIPRKPRPPLTHRVPVTFSHAFAAAGILLSLALIIGVIGYHFLAGLSWVDSILEASMILTGMGPVSALASNAAKLFASVYALLSGTVFLIATGILVSPVIHRVLHRFHVEQGED
jgi:hypothetical protein